MFVKPATPAAENAQPLRVRLLHAPRRLLRPEGETVPDTQDWHRALVRGDVVLGDPPSAPKEGAATGVPAEKVGELIADDQERTATLGTPGSPAAAPAETAPAGAKA